MSEPVWRYLGVELQGPDRVAIKVSRSGTVGLGGDFGQRPPRALTSLDPGLPTHFWLWSWV